MADDRIYYVICGDGCKFEGMTKEQIFTAIAQAVNDGEISDIDSGFITTIKEKNKNAGLSFWVGTQAEYNALPSIVENCFYIISDDTTEDDINENIQSINNYLSAMQVQIQQEIIPAQMQALDAYNEQKARIDDIEKRVLKQTVITVEGEDANNYKKSGIYWFANPKYPAHCPENNVNGWLIVISDRENAGVVKQMWLRCGTADANDWETYVRTYCGGTWSAWRRFATTEDVAAVSSRVSYLENNASLTPPSVTLWSGNVTAGGDLNVSFGDHRLYVARFVMSSITYDVMLTRDSVGSIKNYSGFAYLDTATGTDEMRVSLVHNTNGKHTFKLFKKTNGSFVGLTSGTITNIYGIA